MAILSENTNHNYKTDGYSDLVCDLSEVSKCSPMLILEYAKFLEKKVLHKKLFVPGRKKQFFISELNSEGKF